MVEKYVVILTTFRDKEEAKRISHILLKERLAACIQLKEIESLYLWKDDVACDKEIQGIIKTKKDLFKRVADCIGKHHSYEVPQLISIDISEGSEDYLKWLSEETLS